MADLESAVLRIEDQLRKELEDQGHVAFGNLLASIGSTIEYGADVINIRYFALEYGKYVNDELAASDIRYIPLDGAFREWIQLRFGTSDEKEIKGIYFAIHKTWFNEGRPTQGSYSFSNNGRRTEWISIISEVLQRELSQIARVISTEILNKTIRQSYGTITSE